MALHYEIFTDQKLVLVKGSGTVSGAEVLEHLQELLKDANYQSPMKKLVDYRELESISINAAEAEQIGCYLSDHIDKFSAERCAYVAKSDLAFATVRMQQAFIDGTSLPTNVFRKMDRATQWLGISGLNIPG